MSSPLTDACLRALKRDAARRSDPERFLLNNPDVLAVVRDVVERYPRQAMPWIDEPSEDILGTWLTDRLLERGRLTAMIDKAETVGGLRGLLRKDLEQHTIDRRRSGLTYRLFKRITRLLAEDQGRFAIRVAGSTPATTYWTLQTRASSAVFSGDDDELASLAFAVKGITPLPQFEDAKKQSQFITARDLRSYTDQMLELSGRALTPGQLVRGLELRFPITPHVDSYGHWDPPDNTIGSGPDELWRQQGRLALNSLTPRQRDVIYGLTDGSTPSELAVSLRCSKATISAEMQRIAAVISKHASRENRTDLLNAIEDLRHE